MKNKIKAILKRTALCSGLVFVGASLIGAIVYKFQKPFKPAFYNYKSYLAPDNIKILEDSYDYKQFDTLNQFTKAILTQKAIGGIGSDAQAVQLIRRDKLKKIDYVKLFTDKTPSWAIGKTFEEYFKTAEYKKFQKSLLTQGVWDHLNSKDYTEALKTKIEDDGRESEWNDGQERKLYDYFVPYFSQDMVVAYNPFKVESVLKENGIIEKSTDESGEQISLLSELGKQKLYESDKKIIDSLLNEGFNKNKPIDQKEVRLVDVLKSLSKNNYKRWEITDAVRDNMIYGSAYQYDNDNNYIDINKTGKANDKNEPKLYKKLIDQFEKLIYDGIGASLTDKNIQFIGDGLELLTNLISSSSNVTAAIMYNGDAVDAYFSLDNFASVADGSIRFIRPKSNILLVDGLVLAKSDQVKEETYDKLLSKARDSFYQGLSVDGDTLKANYDWSSAEKVEKYHSYINFDYVAYTPVFKTLYDYVSISKFADLDYFEKEYAKQLFEIKDEYSLFDPITKKRLFNYKVDRTSIIPTDQKTQTNINTYWYQKTKK